MLAALLAILQGAVSTVRTHRDLLVEIAALRQQLAIYKGIRPSKRVASAALQFVPDSRMRSPGSLRPDPK